MPRQKREKSGTGICHVMQGKESKTCPYDFTGKVVSDTHSLLFCAAFHGIANFSKRDLFSDTTFTVAFVCVIVFWIVMWYFVGISPKQQDKEK